MPVVITASGNDDNVLAQVGTDGGYPVTNNGSTRNRIEQVAADAGVGAVPAVSDRNAIEWLAAAITSFVWALSGAFAPLFGRLAADVADLWTVTSPPGSEGSPDGYMGLTDPATPITWASGVRWCERQSVTTDDAEVRCTLLLGSPGESKLVGAKSVGAAGDVEFYLESPIGSEIASVIVPYVPGAVAALGVDADTGDCVAVYNDAPVALPAQAAAFFAAPAVAIGAEIRPSDTGHGSLTVVALKAQGYTNTLSGFDMQGVAL